MRTFLNRNLLILGLTSLLTDVSTEMVYPLLPFFLMSLGSTTAILGFIEGLSESIASLLRVYSGYWSDRMKSRKPWAVVGYAQSTLGRLFLYAATSWLWVLTGRIVDRFGKGIRTAPRDALIAESVPPELRGRAFGFHRAMDTLGATIGACLGYWFFTSYTGEFRTLFLISLVPALLAILLLAGVREADAGMPVNFARRPPFRPMDAWKHAPTRLKWFLAITFLFTLGNSSNQFLLLRAQNLGFRVDTVILLYVGFNLVYALVSYPAGKYSDKVGRKSLLIWGCLLYSIIYLGFAFLRAPLAMWSLFALYGVYNGLTDGVGKALVADLALPDMRATTLGLHAMLTGIALLPASSIAGLLWQQFGAPAPFYFGGALALLAALGLKKCL
jgi:MFS family permease